MVRFITPEKTTDVAAGDSLPVMVRVESSNLASWELTVYAVATGDTLAHRQGGAPASGTEEMDVRYTFVNNLAQKSDIRIVLVAEDVAGLRTRAGRKLRAQ